MNGKKVIYLIIFLFITSTATLTPVVLPYFTIEREQIPAPKLAPDANPDEMQKYSNALLSQTGRNVERLERAQIFGKWFVMSFTVFVMSGLILLAYCMRSLLKKLHK